MTRRELLLQFLISSTIFLTLPNTLKARDRFIKSYDLLEAEPNAR